MTGRKHAYLTRSRPPSPPQPRAANLSPAQIRAAIPQLRHRIAELEAFPVASITHRDDPRVLQLQLAIDTTLVEVFGRDTLEYDRLSLATDLDLTNYVMTVQLGPMFRGGHGGGGTPAHEIREGIDRGRQRAMALLIQQIVLMEERLGDDTNSPIDRAIRAYSNLDLHPEIARSANELYRNGHYANAVEDAVKALNDLVRMRSGEALDGTTLMQKVFSQNNPILRFNPLADESDRNEQLGFMMMFSGAVAGLRNPRAHKLIKDDPERALEFIAFVSLLAKLLAGAKKPSST